MWVVGDDSEEAKEIGYFSGCGCCFSIRYSTGCLSWAPGDKFSVRDTYLFYSLYSLCTLLLSGIQIERYVFSFLLFLFPDLFLP